MFTDNKNVTYILNSGSNVGDLHRTCLEINSLCKEYSVQLLSCWIPRDENKSADYLSRCLDCDDWQIEESIFEKLDKNWGPYTIDRFASHYNTKCVRFNSKFWVPGTEAIDSFNQPWSGEMNWLVPPPNRIAECINKLVSEKCSGTLVLPKWESAPFWPLLITECGRYRWFVKDSMILPLTGTVKAGRGNNGVFTKEPFNFRMLAVRCDCRK